MTASEPAKADPTRLAITELTEIRDMAIGLLWRVDQQRSDYVPVNATSSTAPWWQLPLEDVRAEIDKRLIRLATSAVTSA